MASRAFTIDAAGEVKASDSSAGTSSRRLSRELSATSNSHFGSDRWNSNDDSSNRTAILLLDFQNEFVKKGGKLHDRVSETMEATGVLHNVPKLVELARKMNAMIIYSPVVTKEHGHLKSERMSLYTEEEEEEEEEGSSSFLKQAKYTEMQGLFTENTWNCEIIHDVDPRNDDIILQDRCDFNAFAGTKLLQHLRENNVKHLFVTGFLTDMSVYETSLAAADALPNMTTYVISDCCAAQSMEGHNHALEKLGKNSIDVILTSEAEKILVECAESMKQGALDGSDEWLMIEKIFSAGGVGKNETMSREKLLSLVGTVEPNSEILSTLCDSFSGLGQKQQVSRGDMHKILFKRKSRKTFLEKLPIFLVMIYMPFLYSISTRIPFIFVALEMTEGRGRELWEVGLVLGVYQTSRAVGNLIIVLFGGKNPFKRLQLLLTFSALFGWFFLTFFERPSAPILYQPNVFADEESNDERLIWPLFFLFFVGVCETIVILQRSIMIETAKESPSGIIDEKVLANRFSLQYAFVSFGAVVAFIVGGWLYTNYGYFAVCDFAILIQIGHLAGGILYIVLDRKNKKIFKSDSLDGNDLIRSIIYRFQARSVISKYAQGVANGTESAMSESPSLASAAVKSKKDHVLKHSLGKMFRHYFHQKEDDVACFEHMLTSIDKAETSDSLASRRPLARSIGKKKLSRLVLFLMKLHGSKRLTEREFVSFWAPRVYLSMFESSHEASVTVIWPYMKAVVATQAVAALCIGIFLSTALLSYTQRFGIEAAQVGLLLGVGEAFGMATIFLKTFLSRCGKSGNDRENSIAKAIISRPLNVPCVLIFAGLCSIMFAANSFVFAVTCQLLYSSVNDLSVSLMNELTGTSLPPNEFKKYQGMGQWLRRLGNMVTAILGPILFGISEGLPFILFGAIVITWALILWFLMYDHAAKIEESSTINSTEVQQSCLAGSGLVEPFSPFLETSRTPWHILEQQYFARNKNMINETFNNREKAYDEISLLEHRVRCIGAALEVEKDKRRALEDRMYARVSMELGGRE